MKPLITAVFLLLIAGCASTANVSVPSCATLQSCVSKNNIAVIGEAASAEDILSAAQVGAEKFKKNFGVAPTSVAIVLGGTISQELNQKIKKAGYEQALPWISASDQQKLKMESIRQQVLAQSQDMPKEQQAVILAQAMAQMETQESSDNSEISLTDQMGALTHELGHLWFKSAFRPSTETSTEQGHGYGGWAPDWLDETAAILMENEVLEVDRRKAFSEISKSDLYPFREFLTMEHPALKSAQALKAKYGGGSKEGESRAIALSGKEAEAFLKASNNGNPANFYTQARGFIDFIQAQTGDDLIFADLAMSLGLGSTFEEWLSTRDDIPQSVDTLEREWNEWVGNRR